MRAPMERAMPRSLQNATRCPCGIAIGMQHSTAAPHISANTELGGQLNPPAEARALVEPMAAWTTSGGRRKYSAANGTMTTISASAYHSIVCRQPNAAMARSNSSGHSAPGRKLPPKISPSPEPRRRSNQRLIYTYIGALMPPSPIRPMKNPCPIHSGQGGLKGESARPPPDLKATHITDHTG